ncbi:peptidase, putative, partial [Bodo saltans]
MCARVLSHPLHVDASSAASEGCTSLKLFYAQSSVTSEVLCLNGATMSYETHEQLRVRVYHRNVVPKVPSTMRGDVAEQLRNNIHQILMERCPAQQNKQATFSVQHTSLHSLLMVTPRGVAREALARLPCYQSDSCSVTVCQHAAHNTSVLGAKLLSRRRTRSSLMYGGGGDHQVTLSSQECIGIGWAVELTETMMTHAMEEQLLNNSGGDNRAGRLVLHKEGRDGALLCCTTSGSNEAQEGCSINYSALTSTLSHPAVSHAELLTAPKIVMKYSRGLVQSGQEFVEPLNELLGLKGEGYVIGVSDTGIDTDHCFFWDGSVDVPYDTHSTAHRKLVRYQAYGGRDANSRGDFNPGHGTHVAGTLAGSIATTSSDTAEASTFHGAAPAAKLSFLDLSGPSAGEGIQSRSVESLAALVVSDGASVMSNSWGGELAEYTVSCASIDRYIYETKRSLTVFFAAGNEADRNCNAHPLLPLCDRFTVMAPSTSKNVISVGSSEATMNSWAHADLANYILTVGDNALTFFLLKGTGGPSFPTTIPSKQVLLAEPHNLCNVPTGASYKDTILVAYRGTCTFETKTQNAIAAGAAALIVINIIPGHGTVMGCPDEACASYAINSFMIAQDDGDALVAALQAHGSEMVFASISVTTKEMPDRSIDTLSSFSSHGPSLDGRYKPDLVAVGEMLHSAKSDGNLNSQNCDFWASQGTSMATPLLAGHAVLVQEYLARLHQPAITAPSSALIKAMFVQAARPLRGRYERNFQGDWRSLGETPNFEEGHGFPVLSTILPLNTTSTEATRLSPQLFLVDEVELSSATAVHRYHLSYDGSQAAFQATLAWIDPPGSPSPGSARSMLINNLDLRVLYNASDDDGVSLRYGNAKLDCNPSVRAASSADVLNNVEKVRLVGAPAGDYIVEVVAMHLATSGQKYSLVASGERRESATDTTACPVSHPLFASDPLPAVACGGRGACVGGVCHCDPEWSGAACSTPMPTLAAWETVTMLVEPLAWSMFRLETPLLVSGESLTTTITWSNLSPMSDVDIAVCEGRIPTIDLMNDPSPAPQECVAVDRTADNNDAVINDQLPKEAKTITFQADSGAVYYLGVVAMCCFPSNVTLTMTQGATRASAVRLSTSEIPFNSATNKIPIELVFASKSNGSHRDHQRTVAFHGPASFLTKQSSLFAENHELVLQVRHPRTSELMVNGSCIVINSTTELCSPYASCWMCTATTTSVITSSTTPSNGVLMFANCSSASSCTVFSVPHPSTYRLLFDDNAPEDSSSATNAPVTSSSSSSSSSDSQSSSSSSSDAAHHHHEHNFTFTFRFRGKMGNCIPLQED